MSFSMLYRVISEKQEEHFNLCCWRIVWNTVIETIEGQKDRAFSFTYISIHYNQSFLNMEKLNYFS